MPGLSRGGQRATRAVLISGGAGTTRGLTQRGVINRGDRTEKSGMDKGLTRDEDTALRCLAALDERGLLDEARAELLARLRTRDRRSEIRKEGSIVPDQRSA
jgi:hypothetical protein